MRINLERRFLYIMAEEVEPKRGRGRPRNNPNERPPVPGGRPSKPGRPRSFKGKYDLYDPQAVAMLEKKARVYFVAALGGTQEDCGRAAGVSQNAISKHYRHEYFTGKLDIKLRIRTAQLAKAMEGDVSMLKHLGIAHCEEQKALATIDLPKDELQSGIEKLLDGFRSKKSEGVKEKGEEDNE